MGCASSKPAAAAENRRSSAFDQQLIEAVRVRLRAARGADVASNDTTLTARLCVRAQRHGASRPRIKSMDQVLLRLPAVRDMVESCRVVFAKAHKGGDGQIAVADFAASAEDLQLKLPAETLQQVLAAADVDGDHKISFKARKKSDARPCSPRAARAADASRRVGLAIAQEFTVLLVLCWLLRVRAPPPRAPPPPRRD